jgi:DNA mismatch repair protein MutS2
VTGEVDRHSADLLELPAIRARLAAAAAFAGGREAAESLEPSPDPAVVAERREETEEALRLQEAGVSGPFGAFDVRPAAALAARGGSLDAAALGEVLATAEVALALRGEVVGREEAAPGLAAVMAAVDHGAVERVRAALERSLDRRGGLRDEASPELGSLRRRLAAARRQAADTLRSLVSTLRDHLQEGFTTERAGRPVLAVKASSRSAVPGLVHGASASGQTLFIEPMALVEENNRVRELAGAEHEEVERILRELSRLVGECAEGLRAAVAAMAHVDLALARAAVSRGWRGCVVEESDEVELTAARHPLLDPRSAVPIDLHLAGLRALVVSGPNTGGKTVALKTLGLVALCHQCGLRAPAARARLPVFDRVLSDIGDEQSIAQSLSTFSGHVRALRAILEAAGPRSLALLDEVASGTDPEEGSRLARAVLEALAGRGALVVATTHHAALKEWASDAPGAANAAVDVDPATFAPRYTLRVGAPGASHALEIAARLGLDRDVVEAARRAATPERRALEALLADAAAARAAAEAARAGAEEERAEAARLREEAAERADELRRLQERRAAEAAAVKDAARRAAEAELAGLTRELAALRAEIAAARRAEAARSRERGPGAAARERDRRLGAAAEAAGRARGALSRSYAAPPRPVAVGDHVVDPQMGFRGVVVALERGEAEVQGPGVGGAGARMRLPAARLVPVEGAAEPAPSAPPPPAVTLPPLRAADAEIDVRGRRAEEARAHVRERIDAASMAGLSRVRVIHGKGTGALRAAIREELARHPLVERVEPSPPEEGGEGSTIADLGGGAGG